METFIVEHWQIVSLLFGGMFSLIVALVKREFNAVQTHQDRQDKRMSEMAKDITRLDRDLVESKTDRRSLHKDIKDSFDSMRDQLKLMNESNIRDHQAITNLVRSNGNGH